MRFAINLLNYRPGKIGGTETYLRQLLTHLPEVRGPDELVLILGRDIAGMVPETPYERIVVDVSDGRLVAARILEALTPYRCRFAERALIQARCDVALFPQQSMFPKHVAGPCALVVHAMQHSLQPEQYSLGDRAFRAAAYAHALRRANRIIAISADMQNTLVQQGNVPPEKVVVIPHGRPDLNPDSIQPSARVTGRFLFYPAASYPYKGHQTLLRTFAALRRDGYAGRLVFAGQQTAWWKALEKDIHRLGLETVVLHLGLLPLAEVLELYKSAEAVVMPTNYEGFGLPVMEAVAMRKKLITSRLPIFTELGVPPQYQIDFAEPAQLAAALALPGPTQLTTAPWSWQQSMAALMDELRRLVAQSA